MEQRIPPTDQDISPSHQTITQDNSTNRLENVSLSHGNLYLSSPQVRATTRDFNRGFFDRSDPLENIGDNLSGFSVSTSYPIERKYHNSILNQLYDGVFKKIQQGTIPDASISIVDFNDIATGSSEPPRRYLIIDRETRRNTRMSIYTTFLTYGDNLYISVDSFILGPTNILGAVIGFLIIIIPLFILRGSFLGLVGALVFEAWYLSDIIKGLNQGETLDLLIRKKYNKAFNPGTFNTDDILMYYKSIVPLIIKSMQDVFKANDIPIDVLEKFIQNINYVTNITITGGGVFNAISSIISGSSNRTISTESQKGS